MFLAVVTGEMAATGIWGVEAWNAAQLPMGRKAPTTEHDPAPDATNAKAEKSFFKSFQILNLIAPAKFLLAMEGHILEELGG